MTRSVGPDEPNREMTTARMLGGFYRELLAENIPGELAQDLVRVAGEEILTYGLCVKADKTAGEGVDDAAT